MSQAEPRDSVMVEASHGGTLGCTAATESDFPHVLVCGTLPGESMRLLLSAASAERLGNALLAAARRCTDAQLRLELEAFG